MFETEAEKFMERVFPYEDEEPMYGEEQVKGLLAAFAESVHNKVNEWHYVKNGDLPKSKNKVLVLLKDVEEPILDYYRQDGLWNYALEDEVIAWKEIVLPKD